MVITAIKPQEKDSLRESVYLDGKFGFAISVESRFIHKLKIGAILNESEVLELVQHDQVGKLFLFAQNFLSFRPRSEQEITDQLKRKLAKGGYTDSDKTLDLVITKLKKYDYINDAQFCKWWIEQRQQFRPRGERVLRSELHSKGVSRDIINEQLHSYHSPNGEIEKIARKKSLTYSKLSPLQYRKKMSEYLARQGYGWDEIKDVLATLSQEND